MTFDLHDLYIIYARADGRETAEYLHSLLTRYGVRAVYDQRVLPPQDVSAQVEATIAMSSAVLVCLTAGLLRGNLYYLRREVIYAQICQKPVLMVVTPDYPTDYIPNFGEDIIELCEQTDEEFCVQEIVAWLDQQHGAAMSMISDDPCYDYLAALYQQVVVFLRDQIFTPLTGSFPQLPMVFTVPTEYGAFDVWDNFTDAFHHLHQRAFLLGEPRIGKTVTLMAYARDAVAARLANPRQSVPLVAAIETWPDFQNQPLTHWLSYISGLSTEVVEELAQEGQLLLLLDGLEQLAPENEQIDRLRSFLDHLQQFLRQASTDVQVVVTSQRQSFNGLTASGMTGVIMLKPLTDGQIAEYLTPYPALRTALEANLALRALCRDPFFLSAFVLIYADSDAHASDFRRWSKDAAVLKSKILDDYLERQYDALPAPVFELEQVYHVLGMLAMRAFLEGRRRGQSSATNNIWPSDLKQILGTEAARFIDMGQQMHLLTQIPGQHQIMHFTAPVLRDHLALCFCLDHFYEPGLQHQIVWVLGQIGNAKATEALIELLDEAPMKTRWEIANALGNIGDPHALDTLRTLLLDDESAHVRRKAAEAMGQLDDPLVTDPLVQALDDADASVRASVVDVLASVGGVAVIDILIDRGLSDEDYGVRWQAANALAGIGRPTMPALLDVLMEPGTMVYEGALDAVSQMGEVAVSDLLNTLVRGKKSLRRGVGEALIRVGSPATSHLLDILDDVGRPIKATIIAIMGEIGDRAAVDALLGLARHEDAWIRLNTAAALGQIGDDRAVPILVELLDDGEEPFFKERVCDNALEALRQINTLEARQAIDDWERRNNNGPDQP